jgi:hypothetical protein
MRIEGTVGETFAEEFCSLAPCRASGWVIIGSGRLAPCLVRVADGELTIVHQRALVLRAPASDLEIVSPVLRRLAQIVILRVNGELVAVEFDFVYRRRKFFSSRQRGILRAVQAVFLASSITYIPAVRLGHRLAAEFTAALLAAGALGEKARKG